MRNEAAGVTVPGGFVQAHYLNCVYVVLRLPDRLRFTAIRSEARWLEPGLVDTVRVNQAAA